MKHNFDITQFFKESNGQFSGMRLNVTIIVITACNMALVVTASVANGTVKDSALYLAVAGLVTSMITSALAMKAWQKQNETEAEPSDAPPTAGGPPRG